MPGSLGYSFTPDLANRFKASLNSPTGASPLPQNVGQALQVLSLHLPAFAGGSPIAPDALLNPSAPFRPDPGYNPPVPPGGPGVSPPTSPPAPPRLPPSGPGGPGNPFGPSGPDTGNGGGGGENPPPPNIIFTPPGVGGPPARDPEPPGLDSGPTDTTSTGGDGGNGGLLDLLNQFLNGGGDRTGRGNRQI